MSNRKSHGRKSPRQSIRFLHRKISCRSGLILQCERALHENPRIAVLALDLSTIARYVPPSGNEFPSLDEAYRALVRCAERHHIDLALNIDGAKEVRP